MSKGEFNVQTYQLIATAAAGIEALVGKELRDLGYEVKVENGRVRFQGTMKDVIRTNLWLRTADRVKIVVGEFDARSFEELFDRTENIAWEDLLPIDANFPVEGKSHNSQLHNVPSVQAITKKAIVQRLSNAYHRRTRLAETGATYPLEVAINKAIENNICVVCASGNDAHGDNGSKDEINFPGFYREVIEVGSVNKDNKMSYFSNSNDNVDLVAYGGNIMACYPGNKYAQCSGTSQATPQISGALALLKQKFIAEFGRLPECESELYAQLIKNTKTIPNVSRKLQGNGILYFTGE